MLIIAVQTPKMTMMILQLGGVHPIYLEPNPIGAVQQACQDHRCRRRIVVAVASVACGYVDYCLHGARLTVFIRKKNSITYCAYQSMSTDKPHV